MFVFGERVPDDCRARDWWGGHGLVDKTIIEGRLCSIGSGERKEGLSPGEWKERTVNGTKRRRGSRSQLLQYWQRAAQVRAS